jgi:hypothetical protein
MPNSSYPHGFADGVSIRDIPIDIRLNGKGNVFWVDSVNGSNGNTGTFTKPFATIVYAVSRCTANQGDTIYVAAGHTETLIAAGTLTIATAGITIIFLGEGSNKATITYTTAVSASMVISAANTTLINPRFLSGIDALTSPITITGAYCTILDAEWYDAPAKAATNAVVCSTAANGLTINGYKYYASTTGTAKATHIKLTAVANATLKNIDITGDFSTANIDASTSACTLMNLENIKVNNLNASPQPGIALHANCTGMGKNLDVRVASGTSYVSSVAKLNWDNSALGYNADGYGGDPIGTGAAIGVEGQVAAIKAVTDLLPNAGALTTIDGNTKKIDSATLVAGPTTGSLATFVASGGTALGTPLAASKSIIDAIGSNGTTLVYGSGSALGAVGTSFWVLKTLTSSSITFASPVDITTVSSGGDLVVDQIICKTDSTGLAGGTNFQILSNNTKGLANILVEAVANLGASKTITLDNASVTKIRTVLSSGKKLQVQNTIADGTGGGTIDIYIKFIRVSAGATVAAA